MPEPQIFSVRIERRWDRPRAAVWRWLRTFSHTLCLWHERARQRRQLQLLSDRRLRDLGLTRTDVQIEVSKPFWRA